MARVRQPKAEVKVVRVTCSDCRHFKRDTEGSSFCLDTHEYFMGECMKGLYPDTSIKQFANKLRECKQFQHK